MSASPDRHVKVAASSSWIRRRWPLLAVLAAILLAVVVLVFEPQTLFMDRTVDEAFPAAAEQPAVQEQPAGETDAPAASAPADPAPTVIRSGSFIDRDHPTSGTATIYLTGGDRILRLEDFATDNGPDLRVALTATSADGPASEVEAIYFEVGELKGNIGDQNYEIPGHLDLDQFTSVVIWCDRFNVTFGAANLT